MRRKIFDFVVVKENSRRAIATTRTADETVEQPSILIQDTSKWQLTNRGTNQKITDDIMQMSLFIEDPGEGFPVQVLVTTVAKAKAKPVSKCTSPTPNGETTDNDWTCTADPNAVSNDQDNRNKDLNHFRIKDM